jgi:hypothetical protein
MAMRPGLYTISGLGIELELDRRTIAAALREIPADGEVEGHAGWRMVSALAALGYNRGNGAGGSEYDRERVAWMKERTRKAELERLELEKKLVPLGQVEVVLDAFFGLFRSMLLAAPRILAARLAGRPAIEVEKGLRVHLNDILTRLASTRVVPTKRQAGGNGAHALDA